MSKLILLAAAFVFGCKWLTGRWPWGMWRLVAIEPAPLRAARNLLGVGQAADRDQIIEAHKRLIVRVHPDRGGSEALVHEANAARDLLLGALASRIG